MRDIDFKELTKEDKPLFDSYFRSRYYENSHYNFTNFYMWREPFDLHFAEENGVLYLVGTWEGTDFAWEPFGPVEQREEAVATMLAYFKSKGKPLEFRGVEKGFADAVAGFSGATFDVKADPNNNDYVYLAEKLATLSGRKLHSKKNHLNAFRKNYPQAEYLPITTDIIPACKEELDHWFDRRIEDEAEDKFIRWERNATLEVLNDFDFFQVKGGAIRLDGRIIAFTYGEPLNADTAVVHVEKADPDIRGAYPAINQGFVEDAWKDMRYINREEDLGREGLRKAKKSYKPEKMIVKYNAIQKV